MEDKNFELLTMIYNDLKEFKTNMTDFQNKTNDNFTRIENKLIKVENDLTVFENNNDANFKALFDGYKQTYEKLTVVEQDVKDLSAKVEKQEVEIKVIKGGKAKKASHA